MRKFRSKYLSRLEEIEAFLKENPGLSQRQVATAFHIPERSFFHLVRKTELQNYFFPSVKDIQHIEKIWFQANKSPKQAYVLFCADEELKKNLTFRQFQTLLKKWGYISLYPTKNVGFKKEFTEVFSCQTTKWKDSSVKKHLYELLNQNLAVEFLWEIDPLLEFTHAERYLFMKTKGCWACGLSEHFQKKLPLDLDHISGNRSDHRLSNLRLLCPACHRVTTTHSTKIRVGEATRAEKVYQNFAPEVNIDDMKKSYKKNLKILKE